ncbi:hypothetical protein CNR22_08995 [Sphingobacteriaceae bacterium]|nr:hypothetical protein CNR22_08995 [Sphingobacteriaceae bacterium]
MNKYSICFLLIVSYFEVISQNIKITNIKKLYYYKTSDNFFENKKDSLVGDDIVYDYGKISFTDKKTGRRIKFHMHKDSSFFAFRIPGNPMNPIFAINGKEKRYGIFIGGGKNLYFVFYSRGNIYTTDYDKENYIRAYSGIIDEFGYYLIFTKKNADSKKNGDVEFFIQDNAPLFKKYVDERTDATTYNWNKNYVTIQAEYVRAYNAKFVK